MKELKKIFVGTGEVGGVLFEQLYRHRDLCLYRRTKGELQIGYEVIKARYKKGGKGIIAGKEVVFHEAEHYPSGESWGTYEWYHHNLDTIIEYYNKQAKMMEYDIVLDKSMLTYPEPQTQNA